MKSTADNDTATNDLLEMLDLACALNGMIILFVWGNTETRWALLTEINCLYLKIEF